MERRDLDKAFNGTHVKETPIVGVHKYIDQKYISFYYSTWNGAEYLEVYFRHSLNDVGHYSSRGYTSQKIPKKYQWIFNDLKALLPRINELPGNPQLPNMNTIKVEA